MVGTAAGVPPVILGPPSGALFADPASDKHEASDTHDYQEVDDLTAQMSISHCYMWMVPDTFVGNAGPCKDNRHPAIQKYSI